MPGAQLVLKTLDFEHIVRGATLVFTAEGQLDSQTAYGKAVGAVATVAQKAGAHVVALAGSVTADDAALAALGIDVALSIVSGPMSLADSMAHTAQLLADAAARATRLIALGMSMHP